ncbi:MAG: hypothetical protein EPO07_07615 [Verrucomicrobia bacterium]|nr:MAG: hypothetical protein EPO07_07615 [Verrucomicrobiota bacterium]
MSEFKFACPGCGQHIKCDTTQSGSQMECPTCFRKLIVPQAPAGDAGKLVLTASEVAKRPATTVSNGLGAVAPGTTAKPGPPVAAIAIVVILVAAGASAFIFRDKLFHSAPKPKQSVPEETAAANPDTDSADSNSPAVTNANGAPPPDDSKWTLDLEGVEIPDAPAAGRVRGSGFGLQRATIKGGALDLRQGPAWPPDLGISIAFFATRPEDLANKILTITATQTNAPKVTLRWKDDQQKPATHSVKAGYAARFEFGAIAGGRLPGKFYLCAPDEQKSYAAGTFSAEIRRPTPPKPKTPKPPAK